MPEPTSSGPTPVGDTLTIAQATDGLYTRIFDFAVVP